VAWNGNPDEMKDFVARHGLNFPQINDADGSVFAHFEVPVQPAWVFVDRNGKHHRTGELDADVLLGELSKLVTTA
jgi:AhpC/TSA family